MGSRRGHADQAGFTLVEVLVAIGLLMVATSIVTTVLVQANRVTRTSTSGVTSQSQLLDAVSRLTRDLAVANPITKASTTDLTVQTVRGGNCVRTRWWVQGNALVSLTRSWPGQACPADDGSLSPPPAPTTVVAQLTRVTGLFAFFDNNNQPLPTDPATGAVGNPGSISRVAITVAAQVTDRPSGVVLQTSVSPRTGLNPDGTAVTALPAPGAPVLSGPDVCASTVTLTWTRVLGATGYMLLRDGSTIATIPDGATTSYTDSGLLPGATYRYEIYAQSPAGFSATAGVDTVTRCPDAPVLSGSTIDAGGDAQPNDNQLTWTRPNGATSYLLYRDGSPIATITDPATLTYTDPNRPWGSNPTYRVTARNSGGESTGSNPVTLLLRPDVPALTGATSNGDRVLTWAAPTGADRYELERRYTGSPTWTGLYAGPGTSFTDTAAITADTFDYRVRAGNASGWSGYATATLTPRPAAPQISGAELDGFNRLSWPAVPNATCYRVYRDGAAYATLGATPGFDDGSPGWASTHTYQVIACNKTGDSPGSNTLTLRQGPGPFDIVAAATQQYARYRDKNGAVIYDQPAGARAGWTAAAGATGYEVQMDATRWAVGTATWSNPGFDPATPGAVVTYTVTATAANGKTRTSAAKTVLVPPAPPRNVDARTYCKAVVVNNGWKYGMKFVPAPAVGAADQTVISEQAFEVWNPDAPDGGGYKWVTETRRTTWAPVASWQEDAWGGLYNDSALLSNTRGYGGGMNIQNYRSAAADFGNPWSVTLGVGAWKVGTGPVSCATNPPNWAYNGNWAPVMIWNAF